MAKPIFIVEIPSFHDATEVLAIEKSLRMLSDDYYVLVIQKDQDDITFKAFYEKDFQDVNLEELKEHIKSKITTNEK